jgi:uncharacterized protein involved in exopolysaccharide biosynthesis
MNGSQPDYRTTDLPLRADGDDVSDQASRRVAGESSPYTADIPLVEVLRRVWRRRRSVVACAVAGCVIGLIVAFVSRERFEGEVLLVPQSNEGLRLGGDASRGLAGVAAMAGLNLQPEASSNRAAALATLRSYQLLSSFIAEASIFDVIAREYAPSRGWGINQRPFTMWRAVEALRKHVDVTEDRAGNLVRVDVTWYDPQTASQWANGIVAAADRLLRSQTLVRSRARLDFLQSQYEKSNIVAMREAIATLMEGELRSMTVAQADKNYAFRIVDPAIAPEKHVTPKRMLIVSMATILGALIGAFVVGAVATQERRTLRDLPSGL